MSEFNFCDLVRAKSDRHASEKARVADMIVRRYADLAVPRYTSYPTAAEFSGVVTAEDHARWLRNVDEPDGVSLYVHVPYCREICLYCGCTTKAARRPDVLASYRTALEAEIALVASKLTAPMRVARLHWGGGTPSILGAHGLSSVLAALKYHFVFEDGFEHAIELDPRLVDADLAECLAAIGVNRASLGVQDVESTVQEAIGRIQPIEIVESATRVLRAAGIGKLNFDLIYGLPLQTCESIERTCAAVGALDPERIACYGYAHLPARKANQRRIDETFLPDKSERYEQAKAVSESFLRQGYVPVGIDHFAKPGDPLALAAQQGRLHRNFQGYTDDDCPILIGFGVSSISRFQGGYIQNTTDVAAYRKTIGQGSLASVRGCRLSPQDHLRARVIEELLCNFIVDLKQIDPAADFSDELALLRPLAADGLLTIGRDTITMTDAGRPVVRIAAAVFDEYRNGGTATFSRAV